MRSINKSLAAQMCLHELNDSLNDFAGSRIIILIVKTVNTPGVVRKIQTDVFIDRFLYKAIDRIVHGRNFIETAPCHKGWWNFGAVRFEISDR